MEYFFSEGESFVDDFEVALIRSGKTLSNTSALNFSFNIWCHNPGVGFHQLKKEAQSIILTSGTLSPMTSFSSELNTKFEIVLEANHVIPKDHIWAGVASVGPSGVKLNSSFANSNSSTYQDELGQSILEYCAVIPHGVLCFFPCITIPFPIHFSIQTS